jgi:GrpB-like predicted nucleotidyltransferase (UPF0157 family)
MNTNLEQRIKELICEEVSIVPYNPEWPKLFENEVNFLFHYLPKSLLTRIVHFGSTAIPGMAAKPIIDLLVEVRSFKEAKKQILPLLQLKGYEYFWRTDVSPAYMWFIKRNSRAIRTHHIHMIKVNSKLWDRLYFRDYLIEFPTKAKKYEKLKYLLSEQNLNDRIKYTDGKTKFIIKLTEKAKQYYGAI